jgi:uncharacterized protein (TIGR00297 family)
MGEWRKTISQARDQRQSRLLVWIVAGVLAWSALWWTVEVVSYFGRLLQRGARVKTDEAVYLHVVWSLAGYTLLTPLAVSLTFGLLVWSVRAATRGGVACGMLICYLVTRHFRPAQLWQSGLVLLMALFVLTFLATRAGKQRKVRLGVAEEARGRNAAQVIANLGMAGLIFGSPWQDAVDSFVGPTPWITRPWGEPILWASSAMFLAAVCEATADTISSEIGQAFGGTPYMLTNLKRVPPGTDGAISLMGTSAGVLGAAIVALLALWPLHMQTYEIVTGFLGGLAGLLFDSLLGATLERKGWFGNDLVNFTSTAFASLVALALVLIFCQR